MTDTIFKITNETTGRTIKVNSNENFRLLLKDLNISSKHMKQKALKEKNPLRKKYMLMYAKRKREIENL